MSETELTLHCGQASEIVDTLTLVKKCTTIRSNLDKILKGQNCTYRLGAVPSASFHRFVAAIKSPEDKVELDLDCAHDIYKLAKELGAAGIIEQCKSFIDQHMSDESVKLMEWMTEMKENIEDLAIDLEWIKGIVTEEMQKLARAAPMATPGESPPHERPHESERIKHIEKRMALMEDQMQRQQDTLNEQVTELRRDLDDVKKRQADIEKKLDDNLSETRQLTGRFRKLRPVLEELRSAKDRQATHLDALEATQHSQEEVLKQLSQAIEEAARARNPEVTEELKKCQMTVDEMTRALNSRISSEISTLEKKLVEERKIRESFASEIFKITGQCQVDTENNKKMIAEYQNDRQETLSKIKDDIPGMLLKVTRRVLEEKLKSLDPLINESRTTIEKVSVLENRVKHLETNSQPRHGNDDFARPSPPLHELSLLSERINALEQSSIDERARDLDLKVEDLAGKVDRYRQALAVLKEFVAKNAQK